MKCHKTVWICMIENIFDLAWLEVQWVNTKINNISSPAWLSYQIHLFCMSHTWSPQFVGHHRGTYQQKALVLLKKWTYCCSSHIINVCDWWISYDNMFIWLYLVSPLSVCEGDGLPSGYGSRDSILRPGEKKDWKRRRRISRLPRLLLSNLSVYLGQGSFMFHSADGSHDLCFIRDVAFTVCQHCGEAWVHLMPCPANSPLPACTSSWDCCPALWSVWNPYVFMVTDVSAGQAGI